MFFIQFQSPKGRLQTQIHLPFLQAQKSFNPQRGGYKQWFAYETTTAKLVSIPKGEATNQGKEQALIEVAQVSIPKGEATNTLESLILLYQLYAMVSMFLYQYIISKQHTVQ